MNLPRATLWGRAARTRRWVRDIDAGRWREPCVPEPSTPKLRIKGVEVIAFDERAAELLGLHLPQAKLNNAKTATNLSLTYLKYDAMIFACAIRGKAQEFVTTDPDHHPLASNTNILVRHPSEYEERQMSLLAIGPQ